MNFKEYDMKKLAKRTVEQYAIDAINPVTIKSIITAKGFTVIRYSESSPCDETFKLIETLGIDTNAHVNDSVTYSDKSHRIVFIRSEVNEEEFLYLLALELGKILVCKNPVDKILGTDIKDNINAHEFAHHIYDMANHGLMYNTFKYYIPQGIATLVCVLTLIFTLGYNFVYKPMNAYLIKDGSIDSIIDDIDISDFTGTDKAYDIPVFAQQDFPESSTDESYQSDSTIPSFTIPENERVYYATKSGTKYHIAGCSYINGKETLKLSPFDIQSGNYTPCSRCFK